MQILEIADWRFQVDRETTWERTTTYSYDHCECGYCKNYYEAVDFTCPELRPFLAQFGINLSGPSELMPFEPTLMLACYRVQGKILQWGTASLTVGGILITPETGENDTFLLWVGEIPVPWLQEEAMEDVVSPANLPEFMERMQEVWFLRHGEEIVFS